MNIILGQGSAVKQMPDVSHRSVEVHHQLAAQIAAHVHEKEQTRVKQTSPGYKARFKRDEDKVKKRKALRRDSADGSGTEKQQSLPEGHIIDIKV